MSDRSTWRSQLQKQAAELINEDTTAIELTSQLDFGYVKHNDRYAEWHASTPLLPLVRALFVREIEGYSTSQLHRHLTNHPNDAEALGFDDVPARTTIGRAWRERFGDGLKHTIEHNAQQIRALAHERGSSIGLNAVRPEDKQDTSRRTQDRFIAAKSKEVTEEMQRLVFPAFEFDRAENATHETDTFLELQSHMGLSGSAAESGTDLYADDTGRENGAPDGDTHLHNIKQLGPDAIEEMVDEGIGRMVHEAKHHLEFDRPADVAVDMTYIAYYGERDELEMVMGAPPSKAYDWCYKFATLTVVGENVKFTLAMRPVEKGDRIGEIVRELFWQAREHVSISMVYADSEFCSVDTIHALEEAGVQYVIPSPKNQRVKRAIARMQQDVEVKSEYGIYNSARDRGRNNTGTHTVNGKRGQDSRVHHEQGR